MLGLVRDADGSKKQGERGGERDTEKLLDGTTWNELSRGGSPFRLSCVLRAWAAGFPEFWLGLSGVSSEKGVPSYCS